MWIDIFYKTKIYSFKTSNANSRLKYFFAHGNYYQIRLTGILSMQTDQNIFVLFFFQIFISENIVSVSSDQQRMQHNTTHPYHPHMHRSCDQIWTDYDLR